MVLALKSLVELWRERLAHLDGQRAAGLPGSWPAAVERRVLEFLIRRHGREEGSGQPQSAQPLDSESAFKAASLQLSAEASERLAAPGATPARRGFRSEDELAAIDGEAHRRVEFRRKLAARVSLMTMAFLLFVLWTVSAYIILVVLAI